MDGNSQLMDVAFWSYWNIKIVFERSTKMIDSNLKCIYFVHWALNFNILLFASSVEDQHQVH